MARKTVAELLVDVLVDTDVERAYGVAAARPTGLQIQAFPTERRTSMNTHLKKFPNPSLVTASRFLLAVVMMASSPLFASTSNFLVPSDTAFRIRLDDTLTSLDSRVGDPFSATVVDQGKYRNARVSVT